MTAASAHQPAAQAPCRWYASLRSRLSGCCGSSAAAQPCASSPRIQTAGKGAGLREYLWQSIAMRPSLCIRCSLGSRPVAIRGGGGALLRRSSPSRSLPPATDILEVLGERVQYLRSTTTTHIALIPACAPGSDVTCTLQRHRLQQAAWVACQCECMVWEGGQGSCSRSSTAGRKVQNRKQLLSHGEYISCERSM